MCNFEYPSVVKQTLSRLSVVRRFLWTAIPNVCNNLEQFGKTVSNYIQFRVYLNHFLDFECVYSALYKGNDSYSNGFILSIPNNKFFKMTTSDCVKQCKMETIVFTRWINFVLQSCGRLNLVRDIHCDLSDGVVLVDVMECITGKRIDGAHRNVTLYKQKVENINLIQHFLEKENVELQKEISEYFTFYLTI